MGHMNINNVGTLQLNSNQNPPMGKKGGMTIMDQIKRAHVEIQDFQ